VVSGIVDLLARRVPLVGIASCEFCGENDLVADTARGEPFADPGFGFFVLVVVGAGESNVSRFPSLREV
jgi:hypothetical protein